MNAASPARSRWKLALIAVLFLLPFGVAVVLRFGGWEPPRTRNFGQLLDPPQPMHAIAARTTGGERWTWENTERHWTLLVRLPSECRDECRARLAVLPNVRQALGRHADRLSVFGIVAAADGPDAPIESIELDGPLPGPLGVPAHAELPDAALVDPHGYLVLHYPAGFDPSGLRKDLARLLR